MNNLKLARIILTGVLGVSTISSFILDWSSNHLLHPGWHPHARFHGALLLFFLAGVTALGVWLLWRPSREPELAIKIASLISCSFWLPLFYIPFFLPASTWWAGEVGKEPRYFGAIVYPNLVVAGIFLVLTFVGLWLGRPKKDSLPSVRHSQLLNKQV
ncbi:MAG TPA: hypothetical protein PLK30_03425 [Blastocatellia bacterium]|nr:hypothetical protein [Blastocatellia bacterium]